MPLPERLEPALAEWIPQQRWFAGKGRPITQVVIRTSTELVEGDPGLHHVILDVRQDDTVDHYQLLLGVRGELPRRLEYAQIGESLRPWVYDAVHDPELTRVIPAGMAAGTDIGPVAFRSLPDAPIDLAATSLASPAEQSNTSLVFGEYGICKLFRRITPGVNPDLELTLGLTKAGCRHVPAVYGWAEMPLDGAVTTLAMLSEYLSSGTDGWQLATTSVRDLFAQPVGEHGEEPVAAQAGGDFSAEAERLGEATAAVHRDLAGVFGVGTVGSAGLRATSTLMHEQLAAACAAVPELAPYAPVIGAAFDELAEVPAPLHVQRVHGDYHLGQVMRTDTGWKILDFEGEPTRPAAERRAPGHPLRDVAGMMRSFEYAARYLIGTTGHVIRHGNERLEARARDWADRNRAAFSRGYSLAGGPDPEAHYAVLRAFEFDKAVYEVLYEARNRPGWLHIPLATFAAAAHTH